MTNRTLKTITTTFAALVIIVISAATHAFAQEAGVLDISKVPATSASLKGFVPAGWTLEEQIDGDLNGDGIADHALKLIGDRPAMTKDDTVNERGRALVLVFEGKDGKFRNAAVADKLLQCASCGGAFYGVSPAPANVRIQKGVLVVNQRPRLALGERGDVSL